MSWTEERVETLKRMWAEGQSASQIAKELGGVTRNAVIGKVHRLGLSNRAASGTSEPTADTSDTAAPAAAATPEAQPAAAPSPRPAAAQGDTGPARAEARPAATAPTAAAESCATTTDAPAVPQPRAVSETPAAPPSRKPVPGQPLPPQPSAGEISPEALASVRETEKRARRLSLMELTERTCKWPIGDPATEHFWFCGLPAVQGKPYCEAHVGVAFQPMSARRDRRR
ncbi:GcrA family cell cycle regulator [Phaeovulum vinaykumarii]|uniref:GcrA cell cycle regulator n=1 Tax=Phaeovulum vinaykumarii TaxID=407234 RepID=A0A1N7JMC4_9RHOB|nr:GcrA family cell cycle regulator [Phaeovulum vinaykumarii]SIS50488.1 GcrA cell cycle regulator [Phaeovulum vinaykumarii]SOB90286.1 GcrA cell cycle regulator [Phaeovulum vinaykumarii]